MYLLHFYSVLSVVLFHALNLAFAKIPIGRHTISACLIVSAVASFSWITVRFMYGSILPFEALIVGSIAYPLHDILFIRMNIIPVKNEHTHMSTMWSLDNWVHLPSSHRFDLQVKRATRRVVVTTYVHVFVCVILTIQNTQSFNSTHIQVLCDRILFDLSDSRWNLLSIRNLYPSSFDSCVFHRSSWIRVRC